MFFSSLFGKKDSSSTGTQAVASQPAQAAPAHTDGVAAAHNERSSSVPSSSSGSGLTPTAANLDPDSSVHNASQTLSPLSNITLPTTLSIPLDGYCVSVELAPSYPQHGGAPAQPGGLQVQIAQQMLAFATQQATLLQQVWACGRERLPARSRPSFGSPRLGGLVTGRLNRKQHAIARAAEPACGAIHHLCRSKPATFGCAPPQPAPVYRFTAPALNMHALSHTPKTLMPPFTASAAVHAEPAAGACDGQAAGVADGGVGQAGAGEADEGHGLQRAHGAGVGVGGVGVGVGWGWGCSFQPQVNQDPEAAHSGG